MESQRSAALESHFFAGVRQHHRSQSALRIRSSEETCNFLYVLSTLFLASESNAFALVVNSPHPRPVGRQESPAIAIHSSVGQLVRGGDVLMESDRREALASLVAASLVSLFLYKFWEQGTNLRQAIYSSSGAKKSLSKEQRAQYAQETARYSGKDFRSEAEAGTRDILDVDPMREEGYITEGSAVRPPLRELQLQEIVARGNLDQPGKIDQVADIIGGLEADKGSAFDTAAYVGRWTIPWSGSWESLLNNGDISWIGGPRDRTMKLNGWNGDKTRYAERLFIYGPGEQGIITEYPYTDAGNRSKVLLVRAGAVENLGGNVFAWRMYPGLDQFELGLDGLGNDVLQEDIPGKRIKIGEKDADNRLFTFLETTYLSQTMWIVRPRRPRDNGPVDSRYFVFQRKPFRSVLDRRGIVAESNLKMSDNATVRFGGLLFSGDEDDSGNVIDVYEGWNEKVEKDFGLMKRLTKEEGALR